MSRREREAFINGALHAQSHIGCCTPEDAMVYVRAHAEQAWPPAFETRPREVEVTFKGLEDLEPVFYRFVKGQYEVDMDGDDVWVRAVSIQVTDGGNIIFEPQAFRPETVAELFELFENPTEPVEVDD